MATPMRVTALETIHADGFPNLCYVRVHTDAGLVGLGERVGLADGELRQDITPGGDSILEVILPWER